MYTHILCIGSNIQYICIQLIQDYIQLISIGVSFHRITCFPVQCVVSAFISIKMLSNECLDRGERWIFEKEKKQIANCVLMCFTTRLVIFLPGVAHGHAAADAISISIISGTYSWYFEHRWHSKHLPCSTIITASILVSVQMCQIQTHFQMRMDL